MAEKLVTAADKDALEALPSFFMAEFDLSLMILPPQESLATLIGALLSL